MTAVIDVGNADRNGAGEVKGGWQFNF